MNYLKQFAYWGMAMLSMAGFSACNDSLDEAYKGQAYYGSYYATITGNATNGHTFILEDGMKCNFSGSYDLESLEGWRRAYIYFYYYDTDVNLDNQTLKGTLLEASKIETYDILTLADATDKKVLDTDSVYTINTLQIWGANGYLTTLYNSPYVSGIRPTSTLYYKEEELAQSDTLKLHMAVNRHSTGSIHGSTNLIDSHLLESFYERYSSRDSLIVAIYSENLAPATAKIASKSMLTPEKQ